MASDIPALQSTEIDLILYYILKPFNLPIPPHLISKSLLQRHHYLEISPYDEPEKYLSWKAPPGLIATLESIQVSDEAINLAIRYLHDGEVLYGYASVDIFRLVLVWDDDDLAWKYHDIASMPFPLSSCLSPQEALTTHLENAEAKYWDAYDNIASTQEVGSVSTEGDQISNTEDVYWNRYASTKGMPITMTSQTRLYI